jgi:hypothetical protein
MYVKDLKRIRHCYTTVIDARSAVRCSRIWNHATDMKRIVMSQLNILFLVENMINLNLSLIRLKMYMMTYSRKKRHRMYDKFNPTVESDDDKYYPYECVLLILKPC